MGLLRDRIALALAVALATTLCGAGSAHARWYKAETDRFIIYGEAREPVVRELAVKLATFEAVLREVHRAPQPQSPSQKLEIYVLRDYRDARRILPGSSLYEWYAATPERIYAVSTQWRDSSTSRYALFHEYAHHFMYENFPAPYPAWFVEGWADYFATGEFSGEKVTFGRADQFYASLLLHGRWLPLEEVLSASIGQIQDDRRSMFFAQAWLLVHFLRSTPDRVDQLNRAMSEIAKGADPATAIQVASGMNLTQLTSELRKYRELSYFSVRTPKEEPRVAVIELPEEVGAFILDDLRLSALEPELIDQAYIQDLRHRAGRHSDDCRVQRVLAQAEFAVGDVTAGERLMTKCLERAPGDVENLRIAGWGQLKAGERNPEERLARFRAARAHFNTAYGLDQGDYRILFGYAQSRTVEPAFPNDNDLTVLLAARDLAPQVAQVSMLAGEAMIARGRRDEGQRLLAYVANNPHGGPLAARAKALIEGRTVAEADAAAALVRQANAKHGKPGSTILNSTP